MLPLKLTLEGIYSYQERQTIDFKNLTQSQLFGIFGHVGSGKSTILEAISLALYGVSERLAKNDNLNYNLMNLRSSSLFIDFEFEAGAERDHYRFTVKSNRQQKHFEKVNTLERQQYKWLNNEWVPIKANDAEPILGLSYPYFRRTIIIPQGRFQEFLQLKDRERTQMMQDLFDLHRFDLQDQVKALKNQTSENLQHVEGSLTSYQSVSPEALTGKWESLHTLQGDLSHLRIVQEKKAQQYQHLQQLKQLFEHYQEAWQYFRKLADQKPEYDQLGETIRQVRNCRYSFKDRLDRTKKLEQSLEAQQKTLQQSTNDLQDLESRFQQNQTQLDNLKSRFTDLSTFRDYLRELETIQQIHEYEERLNKKSQERDRAQEAVEKANKAFQDELQEWQRITDELQAQHQKMPDQASLSAVKNWFTQLSNYEEQKKQIQEEINLKEQAVTALKNQYQQLIQDYHLASLNADFPSYSFKSLRQALQDLKTSYNTELEKLDQTVLKLRTQEAFEEHAANLKPGEPCPVCGAYEHPVPLKVGDTQKTLKAKNQEREQLKSWISTMDEALQALEGLKSQYQHLSQEREQRGVSLNQLKSQLTTHQENFVWEAYRDMSEAQVDEALKNAKAQQDHLQALEQKRNNAEQAKENARKQSQEADQKRQEHQQAVNQLSERISANKGQIRYLSIEDFRDFDNDTLHARLEQWRGWYNQMDELTQTQEQLNETIQNQKQKAEQIRTQINEQKRTRDEIDQELTHLLEQSEFNSLGEVQALLDQYQNLDVDTEEERLNTFYRQYEAQRGVLEDYKARIDKAEPFDDKAYQSARIALEETNEALRTAENRVAVLKEEMQNLQKALREKRTLEARQESLKTRHSNLEVMEKLFRGRGFVRYISSVFLEELVRSANERFRHLTNNQLQLEVSGNANLQIRDLLNNGHLRSVKTLSGGQTFQVSLSLALALAERIQKLTQSQQNFFFLDEGFGSLDRQSLNLVFDTLYRLRKENRIVGLISHVEELKEGLETALTVENHPERGSLISADY